MLRRGKILISEPYLGDDNFERTVILLCEHNGEGSLGFVLNKPSVVTVESILELEGFSQSVMIGGPVSQDSVHFVYTGKAIFEHSLEVTDTLHLGGSFEKLQEMANLKLVNPQTFKFFLGYSGWAPGQLEKEMEENSWIVSEINVCQVFDMKPEKMWQEILRDMGGKYKMYSNFPEDPRLN